MSIFYSNICFSFVQEELKAYKKKHGNVSGNNTTLLQMAISLCTFFFRSTLTYECTRINLQCHVPTKYKANTALGRWVSTQRAEYKKFCEGDEKSSMTTEKIRRLEEIGFAWFMALWACRLKCCFTGAFIFIIEHVLLLEHGLSDSLNAGRSGNIYTCVLLSNELVIKFIICSLSLKPLACIRSNYLDFTLTAKDIQCNSYNSTNTLKWVMTSVYS